jgi:hypothetical protein
MGVTTIQGVIENGHVVLSEPIDLQENKVVYVVIPNFESPKRILSPRLADKNQAVDFIKEVDDLSDA